MTLPARYRKDRRISSFEARGLSMGGDQFTRYVDAGLVGLVVSVDEAAYLANPGAYDRAAVVHVLRAGHKALARCKPDVRDRLAVIHTMARRDPRYARSLDRRAVALRIEGLAFPIEDDVILAALRRMVADVTQPIRVLVRVGLLRDAADARREGRVNGPVPTIGQRGPLPESVTEQPWPRHPDEWLALLTTGALARVPGWYRQAREVIQYVGDPLGVADDELVLGLAILDLDRAQRGTFTRAPVALPPQQRFGGRFAVPPPD